MMITIRLILLTLYCSCLLTAASSTPPKIEQNPNSITVNVSDPVTLECRASGEPKPKISWFKDGAQLSTAQSAKYTLIHDSNLFIFSASLGKGNKSDSGVYYCKAENQFGMAMSSNATLTITYLKEDFREMPKSRQVNGGSVVMMECKAPRGHPEPVLWWEKNGASIQSTHSIINNNSTLVISNASLADNGEYVCVAKNEAGTRRTAPAHLNVFEKPSFVLQPETSKQESGTRVELACQANGFPKPMIEWKKDGSIESIPLKAQISEHMLIVPNVQVEDEGEYTCVATNQLGAVEAKAYLIVYEKPTFVKAMANLTIGIESKSITIECNARGKPQPVIYWAKSTQSGAKASSDLGSLTTQDDFLILENGNLFIEKLSKKYEGTYLCQASNEYGNIETKTYLQVKPIQTKPPPLIIYGPQNQTIPINTQASLECVSSREVGLNQPWPTISWYKGSQLINIQPGYEYNNKYKLLDSGMLEINSVQKSDSGVYKCVATNSYGQTVSMPAHLNVENPNNQYVEFQRNHETTALPSAPTQPVILATTTRSVSLSWQPSSHSGHSPLRSYTIEYFSPEWAKHLPGWTVLVENVGPVSSFTVENLQPDTYYMFVVRARNGQGYGPPSQISDLVKTLFEPQVLFRNKNSNELLEKALTGEVVQLNEPAEVLSSTSLNISWKIYKSAFLIEGFYIKYKPIGSKEYISETLNDNKRSWYIINNLQKFTAYEVLVEPFSGAIRGSESNVVQAKTKEDVPTQSPISLSVELDTVTSVSIKWQPPPFNHMNGIILGYKISCVANETKFNLNLNTNSTTRAIILGNLIENMRYCIKVAAYTKVGVGPFTTPKCMEMSSLNLINNQVSKKELPGTIYERVKGVVGELWFIVVASVSVLVLVSMFLYCVVCRIKRQLPFKKKQHKYLSSSENCSLNVPHKIDQNGNRYKLVNDTIWLDTMHSNSNNSNPECCCVPDLHHQIFVQQNSANGNVHLIHDLNNPSLDKQRLHNLSLKSKFTNQDSSNANPNCCNTSLTSSNTAAPQYAEIYGPTLHQLQQMANPYATTGLFVNGAPTDKTNSFNLVNSTNVRNMPVGILDSNGNMKYSSFTIKMINDKQQQQHQTDPELLANTLITNPAALPLSEQKKLLKYLQATQSQTNTPRVQIKNMQNRVKSVENQHHHHQFNNHHHMQGHQTMGHNFHNCCSIDPDSLTVQQQQLLSLLADHNQNETTNDAIRNLIELNSKQQQQPNSSTPLPSLPLQPPPSLASALLAQQQQQHQQLIESYNYVANTLARNQAASPVQYNSPWNVNLEPSVANSNSTFMTRITKNTADTLASSTYTAQQYANRQSTANKQKLQIKIQQEQVQQQQDYSSISPIDEIADAEFTNKIDEYHQLQYHPHLMQQTKNVYSPNKKIDSKPIAKENPNTNMAQSWASVTDTNSNPIISSSYESTQSSSNQNSSISNSSNSSQLSSKRSSRSGDDLPSLVTKYQQQQQHYINNQLKTRNELSDGNPKHALISDDTNEVFMSELPQTIL